MVSWGQLHYVGKIPFHSFEEHHPLLDRTTQRMAVAWLIVDPDRKVGCDKMMLNGDTQVARKLGSERIAQLNSVWINLSGSGTRCPTAC